MTFFDHKEHIFLEYHSVCPLVGIRTPLPPLPQASVPPSQGTKTGVGHIRLRVRGWRSPNSDDWRKSLAHSVYLVPLTNPLL
jgi:hypothetical protein